MLVRLLAATAVASTQPAPQIYQVTECLPAGAPAYWSTSCKPGEKEGRAYMFPSIRELSERELIDMARKLSK